MLFSEYVTNAMETFILCGDDEKISTNEIKTFINSYSEDFNSVTQEEKESAFSSILKLLYKMEVEVI